MAFEKEGRMLEQREADGKRNQLSVKHRVDEEYPRGSLEIAGAIRLSRLAEDKVMILEDQFKSSYDCSACKGAKRVRRACTKCEGTGKFKDTEDAVSFCGKCDGAGFSWADCDTCKGKGSIIVIPEELKSRPTSGVIYAIGPDVTIWQIGDRVVYTGFSGHLLPFKGNTRIRVMRQVDPFCLVESITDTEFNSEIKFVDTDTAYETV